MGFYEASVEINAPPEKVWAFVSDVKRYPDWVAFTDRLVSGGEEPLELGSVYREFGGPIDMFKSETTWRVTEIEPTTRQVHEGHGQGIDRILITMALTPSGDGTRLTNIADVRARWYWLPIALPLEILFINRISRRKMRQSLDSLKTLVEAEQA